MSLSQTHFADPADDTLSLIEDFLETNSWPHEREEDDAVQCIVPSRWGEMGGLFALRLDPPALHFSVTLDCKPVRARKAAIAELVMMMNERLWLGHFDYWADEGAILFRHALPMLDRDCPTGGEVRCIMAAAVDAIDRFIPAFNFVVWAGKSPQEAIEAAMFETKGEA